MKTKAIVLPCLALSLFFLQAGCASVDPVTHREHLGYLSARWYDFMDMFELNLAVDSEASLYAAAAVEPVVVGGGLIESYKLGFDGRCFGTWKESKAMIGLGPEVFVRYEKEPLHGNRYLKDASYKPHRSNVAEGSSNLFYVEWGMDQRIYDHEKRIGDVTVEANVVAFGVDVSFSLMETFDFITGLFFIDVISDDDWVAPRPDRTVPLFGEEDREDAQEKTEGEDGGDGGEKETP